MQSKPVLSEATFPYVHYCFSSFVGVFQETLTNGRMDLVEEDPRVCWKSVVFQFEGHASVELKTTSSYADSAASNDVHQLLTLLKNKI